MGVAASAYGEWRAGDPIETIRGASQKENIGESDQTMGKLWENGYNADGLDGSRKSENASRENGEHASAEQTCTEAKEQLT